VTTELIAEMARHYEVPYWDVLTGFKFIADIIRKNEEHMTFIGGGEESYGFMIGDFVRDKDAVSSCCMLAEMAAWAKSRGQSMYDILLEMYLNFSLYQESLINVVRKGKSGAEEIQQMMADFRKNPPEKLDGSPVITIRDYQEQMSTDCITGARTPLDLPKSNVLQFLLEDGSKISVRPSGTEPKIKFYFSVKGRLEKKEDYKMAKRRLDEKILNIQRELELN
jgi:phosphoglucomutase